MAAATDAGHRWPLASATARLLWLRACCAVAEGADVPLSHAVLDASPPAVCVAAVLGDALHRVAVLGGREGMSRSLGSVYGGCVTRFLGGSLRGVVSRVIHTPVVASFCNGIALTVDGCTLLVADGTWRSHAIYAISSRPRSRARVIGGEGKGPLQFKGLRQVCVAPDGFVFVADGSNNRVQVLTPRLCFHCFIGDGRLNLLACAPTRTSSSCRRCMGTASLCFAVVTARFFVASGRTAAATVS
jgi:hypothetical protein